MMCRTFPSLMIVALVSSLAGCDSGPALVPVSGQVLIDGQPLTYGGIRLLPTEGQPADARLDQQGRFTLMTGEEEGCVKGTHTVEIGAVEAISEYENKKHAPDKYASAATSGLTAMIDGPTEDLVINLSWEGEQKPSRP